MAGPYLNQNVMTTLEEATRYLKREVSDEPERSQLVAALNAAAAWLEGNRGAGRRLAARTYRASQAGNWTLTPASAAATVFNGPTPKVYDRLLSPGDLAPGTYVKAIVVADPVQVTLSVPAIVAGTGVYPVTFGSAPDDQYRRVNLGHFYLNESPAIELYSVALWNWNTADYVVVDTTKARLDKDSGLVELASGALAWGWGPFGVSVPRGVAYSDLRVEYAAGYGPDDAEYAVLQHATHRLAQCYFQDWANALARVADKALAGATFRFTDFDVPKDVERVAHSFRRLG